MVIREKGEFTIDFVNGDYRLQRLNAKIDTAANGVEIRYQTADIGTLDPMLQDVSLAKDLKDTFIIRRDGTEIIIQEGKLLNREVLSSGTAEGIDVAMFHATLIAETYAFFLTKILNHTKLNISFLC